MPLRIRAVVPYTLPGVLALIGWWWYISRKKERLISHGSPEGAPTDTGLITSPTEGSNGLVERVSPINDTERSAHGPVHVTNLKREPESFSYTHNQDYEAASSLRRCSEEDGSHLGRIRGEEVLKPSDLTQQLPGRDDTLQVTVNEHRDAEEGSVQGLVRELEEHQLRDLASGSEGSVEAFILPCKSNDVTRSPDTKTYLSDAERPEPEGEVAKHHGPANIQEDICTVTSAKVQSIPPSESDTQETQRSSKDFFVTSSPYSTSVSLTTVQDSLSLSVTPEGINVQSSGDEQDLELLAAGLISGVISAATQEVLSVTSCQITDGDQQGCISSAAVPCSEQEPAIAQDHHHPLTSSSPINESRGATEKGITNGCSLPPISEPVEVSRRDHKTDSVPTDFLTSSQETSQSVSSLNMKLRDEAVVIAEDSACSTCHSEDGISSEDLPSSTYDHRLDVVTDLSAKEAESAKSLVETCTKAVDLTVTEENSVDAECEVKKLNGAGLGYGAHGTSEVETDQSGGSDVNSMDSVDSGCTMGTGENQSNHAASLSSELVIWEIEVPKLLVGRLIGKQGRFVSYIKQNSGAKIYISTLPYTQDFQICHIEGAQQQVDKALSLIRKRFKDLDLTNLYAPPPPPLTLPSLPMTSWLLLPSGVTVEVIVVNIVSAGHVFVQQHTHPTYHALRSLDQQMFLCYSQPGTPGLPSPAEVGVICAAPAGEGAWWRAQVITFYKETSEVEIRYVDYGGYDRVKIDSLRQIRSDFVTLPFQGAEVLLDNIAPLPGEDRFSPEATSALEEMTRLPLLAQVSNYDNNTGLPLVHLWNMVGEEVISVNRTLAERGLVLWVDGF